MQNMDMDNIYTISQLLFSHSLNNNYSIIKSTI